MSNEGLRARALIYATDKFSNQFVTAGQFVDAIADFAQQIREEDCKAVCELCNGPDNLDGAVRDKTGKWVHVLIRGTQICAAAAIRNLAEKEKV